MKHCYQLEYQIEYRSLCIVRRGLFCSKVKVFTDFPTNWHDTLLPAQREKGRNAQSTPSIGIFPPLYEKNTENKGSQDQR